MTKITFVILFFYFNKKIFLSSSPAELVPILGTEMGFFVILVLSSGGTSGFSAIESVFEICLLFRTSDL